MWKRQPLKLDRYYAAFSKRYISRVKVSELDNAYVPKNMEDNMMLVTKRVKLAEPTIVRGLLENGFAVIDSFLGDNVCKYYRKEAEGLYNRGSMSISQSTRWDADSNAAVSYDKVNVKSAQLNGGDDYFLAPRLHEYVVALIKALVPSVIHQTIVVNFSIC
jgi:hypothetical protein